ncbi:hypothetical protein JTE90_009469 [Oedothorax gibbosus]|uniref:Sucrose-6-phosphate hydrolase n=1 Tax=Oedothorax gibbosus TaxID=931172 RepID=A0AAV6VV22_9ARAC|nr:hypothetical protein JTE90_009469 [Oedothorax gibbosus]
MFFLTFTLLLAANSIPGLTSRSIIAEDSNQDDYLLIKINGLVNERSIDKFLENIAADVRKFDPSLCAGPTPYTPPKSEWYPTYHLAPPSGWMNDPNGLIHFGGYFHAFYQHNPYAPEPEQIHWGHARSTDMLEWEHLPPALAPSIEEDKNGCFSGSAVNDGGTLKLMYTGNGDVQVQCLATSNDSSGIHFTKQGKVLDNPEGVINFRDPKVLPLNGEWFVVIGTEFQGEGQIRLYKSGDLQQWEEQGVLTDRQSGLGGYMWECPDFFPLEDKYLLMFSPQGIKPEGYLYRNLYDNGYFLGTWSPDTPFDIEKEFTLLDHGHDFYAPQTFQAPDERRIVIAWMDMWESPMPEKKQGWAGSLTLPREMTLNDDGDLLINPIREVEGLRTEPTTNSETILHSEKLLLSDEVYAAEVDITWNLTSSVAETYGLHLGHPNSSEGLFLYVDNQAQRLTLDRRYPQYDLVGYRSVSLSNKDTVSLRVFYDHSSVEVFVDGGRSCMSSRIYPTMKKRQLSLYAENGDATLLSSTLWMLQK